MAETATLPSIAYIDEIEGARDDFLTDAYNSGLFKNIYTLPPEQHLQDMLDSIFELQVDAIISDFRLTEAGPVDYNGEILIEAILSQRARFPCFIQTSADDLALEAADDINRVYSKASDRPQFMKRIALQIERHRFRQEEWRTELETLLALDRGELTALQIERIVELDEAIETNLSLGSPIARQAKRDIIENKNLAKRHIELIDETEKLIDKMRRELDG